MGNENRAIELLIGADLYGPLLTGVVEQLDCGPTAIQTRLGWTLLGEVNGVCNRDMTTVACSVTDLALIQLWDLEVLGIRDPVEVMSSQEKEKLIQQQLIKGMKRKPDGRYVVQLPFKEGHPSLPDNRSMAMRRLESTTRKLMEAKLFDAYGALFRSWEQEGFIEIVPEGDINGVHYLPHRAVVKPESLTTPVRPVFDASCKRGKEPSLNDCLHKGVNYIQLIPDILLRFRSKKIGFVSDIRKAFQMIEVEERHRDFLRFLWWEDDTMKTMKVYRHVRVPFGATCSPFILGAVLNAHLSNVPEESKEMGSKLLEAFYVDNCVNSESTVMEYEDFKKKATRLMAEAQMDLRMWMANVDDNIDPATEVVSVLGLLWNRKEDSLCVDTSKITIPSKLSKRTALSNIQKVFDPVGFTSPATLPVKLLLQRLWNKKIKWDDEMPEEEKRIIEEWFDHVKWLSQIKIPRLATGGEEESNWSLHTFVDASKYAFGVVVYLRVKKAKGVWIQLLGAKARVAPPKMTSIPRLELVACLIGSNLTASIKKALKLETIEETYWSDSTTALAWIRRNDDWGTFVGNRVAKILKVTSFECWRHVPGEANPADLPSRGCSPKQLLDSRWWEGPVWLYGEEETWPSVIEAVNEDVVNEERKKTSVCANMNVISSQWKDYPYKSWVKIFGWTVRFIENCRKAKHQRQRGMLTSAELEKGELYLMKIVQQETAVEERIKKMKMFEHVRDQYGLVRVKTRLTYREDLADFKYPVVIGGNHPIVWRMIVDKHREKCHAGVVYLMANLRSKFWILKSRQTIKAVVRKCFSCRKYAAKPFVTETAPLPENRIKDAEPFEVTGVDLAGPFILKNGKKAWMVIATCAIYRGVHLEIVDSLSTYAFIRALGKFIKRYRRPAVIYSDNGTNFRGTDNLFKKIKWEDILKDDIVKPIKWIFNPSAAPWWGGFWERLIRSIKDLLYRTVGRGSLTRSELELIIEDVAGVINHRPLTYVTETGSDLEPLTPAMFLNPLGMTAFPEGMVAEGAKLRIRYKYVQQLKAELRQRWRKEYLGLLTSRPQNPTRCPTVGELVVVSKDNQKRVEWPLARIVELMPGADGVVRVAKVKTANGILIRPVQRLHPLELDSSVGGMADKQLEKRTRCGRVVRIPARFQ